MTLTRYQVFVVALLAVLNFSIILDFMILSPLGVQLMPALGITTRQFGLVVSVYAFSAGTAGILTAGFADRFDRKKLLLVFYAGFVLGTVLCGLAKSYPQLIVARIVTGVFGGVIGSISMAIATDLFPIEVRGRVMGVVQTAFAVAQVAGLPAGLALMNLYDWHAPFLMIAGICVLVGVVIIVALKPVTGHLALRHERNAFVHLFSTLSNPFYLRGFAATTLLATGGFMLLPFGTTFTVNNLGIAKQRLPLVYLITGCTLVVLGPVIGRLSDRIGKFRMFLIGTAVSIVMVIITCNLGVTPLGWVILANALMFVGVTARMISTSALISAVPEASDRGAYMSVNSAVQQFSGGIAANLAGMIVVQTASGHLEHYPLLGYVVVAAMLITLTLMYSIHRLVVAKVGSRAR